MRRLILLSLLLAGCGKGSSNGPLTSTPSPVTHGPCYSLANGSWQGNVHPTNTLTLTDQCTGTGSLCHEIFTYQPQSDGITAIVIVTATSGGPNCLPLGASTVTVNFLANQNNNQISVTVNPVGPFDQDTYNRLSGP